MQAERVTVCGRSGTTTIVSKSSGSTRASSEQAQLEAKREREAEIEAFLGPEKSQTYREYQRTLVARARVSQLGEQLGALGVPLNTEQRRELITLMTEEKERIPAPNPASGKGTLDDLKRHLDWMDDYNRRVRERATGTLSPQQIKYLSDHHALQAANRRSALEMQRQERLAGLNTTNHLFYPGD